MIQRKQSNTRKVVVVVLKREERSEGNSLKQNLVVFNFHFDEADITVY